MQVSLGRCHYGGNDAATLTGVHPDRPGWIAVCATHAERAEQDGYRLHEHADLFAEPYPDDPAPTLPALTPTPAAVAEARRSRAAADWDELEAILDSDE